MELRQYWNLFWKWAWLIALGAVLAGGAAYLVSHNTTPVYQATATLRISTADSPNMSEYTALLGSQRLAQTYAELLTKDPVLDGVTANLGLDRPGAEPWSGLSVQLVRDTDLIEVSVQHSDPAMAQAIANEIPMVFAEQDQAMQAARYAQLKEGLQGEIDSLAVDIQNLQSRIATKQSVGAPSAEVIGLQSQLEQARANSTTLLQNLGAVQLAEAQSGSNVIVAAPARLPLAPIGPRTMQNTLLAAVVGAMLAVGVAFLVEYLDDTLKTPDDVAAALGTTTLAAVAQSKNGKNGSAWEHLEVVDAPKSTVSEAYRVLRTNLRFSTVDRPTRSVLVTSASPVEGKSVTVANLAVVMAQAGQRVIVVDSDLRRPRLHKLFGLVNGRGLTDALVDGRAGLGAWLQETALPNLRIMTSGPLPPNPSELLSSQRMQQLVAQLEEAADVVLFDSPPLVAVTDASILARQVDGTVLVVESGETRRAMAEQALQALEQVGATVLGVVLNKVSVGKHGYAYYYYYSGHYGENGNRPPRSKLQRAWQWLVPRAETGD